MTIILWINNTIIICITKNNATINNNYWRLQDLILHFKIPIGTQKRNVWKFIHNLGTRPQKDSPALLYMKQNCHNTYIYKEIQLKTYNLIHQKEEWHNSLLNCVCNNYVPLIYPVTFLYILQNTCHKFGTSLVKHVFVVPSLLWVRFYAVPVSSWLPTFRDGPSVPPWRWTRHCITPQNNGLNYTAQHTSEMPQSFCDFKSLYKRFLSVISSCWCAENLMLTIWYKSGENMQLIHL